MILAVNFADDDNLLRLGRAEAKGDGVVRIDLRGNDGGTAATASTPAGAAGRLRPCGDSCCSQRGDNPNGAS